LLSVDEQGYVRRVHDVAAGATTCTACAPRIYIVRELFQERKIR